MKLDVKHICPFGKHAEAEQAKYAYCCGVMGLDVFTDL